MKIRIVKEKKITPLPITFPTKNSAFNKIQQAATNSVAAAKHTLNIFMHELVYDAIWYHANLDHESELGGSLIGYYAQDPESKEQFVLITDVLNQPLEYYLAATDIRFTSQFYDDLSNYLDRLQPKYPNLLRLGLYHTHPNYGIFLSKTDARTFRGIFKEPWQIAMIVDPVKLEDGMFMWDNGEISVQAAYYLYSTTDPTYQPHVAPTTNKILAKYNRQLTDKIEKKTYQKIPRPFAPLNTPTQQIAAARKTGLEKLKITAQSRAKIDLKQPTHFHRMCPLFDMHYVNQEIKLKKYFKSLKIGQQEEYPYMVFIHEDLIATLQQLMEGTTEQVGLLKGQFCFDKQKDQYFLMIDDIITAPLTTDIFPSRAIQRLLNKEQAKNGFNCIGWLYATQKIKQPMFSFFDKHQELFAKNHEIGFVIPTKTATSTQLDLTNINLVAYNFDKSVPFDYFPHLFLYKKPY